MKRRAAAAVLVSALCLVAAPARIARQGLQSVEQSLDRRLQQFNADDPIDLLGPARAIYVDKLGVVVSAEVNLVMTAITPFRPQITGEQLEKLRLKKVARVGDIRRIMRDTMVHTAAALKSLGPDEQIAVGITFFHRPFELTKDLPAQIVMQAPKRVLADFEAGKLQGTALEAAIQEQVF